MTLTAALPEVTSEAIRQGGTLEAEVPWRMQAGPMTFRRYVFCAFPDLEKLVRLGPAPGERAVTYTVAGQDVPPIAADIVAALQALGDNRKPPIRRR